MIYHLTFIYRSLIADFLTPVIIARYQLIYCRRGMSSSLLLQLLIVSCMSMPCELGLVYSLWCFTMHEYGLPSEEYYRYK